ncbi:hypothetical protein LTR36_005815 [Oleoguttula mirabilis]|uniref:Reticulon-like protein n=1 Tax=Oleoguttula mirabilis TaxID=1507867 RepID=A0AAV9JDB5_9PEZI|nr:hypothetical protein LTR36_005815 [Oleoguttula mirabilis]
MASEQQSYPNLNPSNGNSSISNTAGNAMENAKSNAQSAMDSIKNHPTVQNIQNGPVADKARQEAYQTQSEFGNLAGARQTPSTQTATGQDLTHYHSFFYSLLSWENPRATAISYVTIVLFIFACRYVPLVRYGLRLTWMVLGITAAAEIAGRMVFDQGFASKLRPKKYYTIPRETLESTIDDALHFVNFFVIESQRIVFAENVYATVAAFFTALITYGLIKITPAWGLALLGITSAYFVPLGYITNKEFIDSHLSNAGNIIGQQTQQVRDLASQHTSKAMEASSNTLKTYSARASEMVGQTKQKAVEKNIVSPQTANNAESTVKGENFPEAPKSDLSGPDTTQAESARAEPVLEASY